MLFTDPTFLFLVLPVTCALFYVITPKWGTSAGFAFLLVVSLLLYTGWGWFYFALLVASFSANFLSAYWVLALPDKHVRARKAALILGLLYNFGTLFYFKYSLYVGQIFSGNRGGVQTLVDLAIPIGISFYTFQQAIFLVDAFNRDKSVVAYLGDLGSPRGVVRAYIRHSFFVSFFPHLIIGPIVYLSEFQPQIESRRFGRLDIRDLEVGATLIIIGLFKKVVLADRFGWLVDSVFGAAESHSPLSATAAWLGVLAYYIQLYFDFSGYSDMALGTARTLGIRFPYNFYSPLKSVGIMDFYRRWHITLTRVIARFLYIPLSMQGARFALRHRLPKFLSRALMQWLPLLLNFEAIALWHGARTTFVLFGLAHGVWYVLETEVRAGKWWKQWRRKTSDRFRAVLGRLIFFLPMLLTFALFRSPTVEVFGRVLESMFTGGFRLLVEEKAQLHGIQYIPIGFAIAWLLPNSMEFLRRYRPGIRTYDNANYVWRRLFFAWRPNWIWSLVVAGMLIEALHQIGRQPPFLYMGF